MVFLENLSHSFQQQSLTAFLCNGREQIIYTYTVLIILVVVENSQFCVKKSTEYFLFSRQ
jgi:hypothetical protein